MSVTRVSVVVKRLVSDVVPYEEEEAVPLGALGRWLLCRKEAYTGHPFQVGSFIEIKWVGEGKEERKREREGDAERERGKGKREK